MSKSVIVAARRSPVGKYLGSLSRIASPELGALVAKQVLNETGAISIGIDEVFVGCVLQGGLGQNPARQVALKAGIGDVVTAETLNELLGIPELIVIEYAFEQQDDVSIVHIICKHRHDVFLSVVQKDGIGAKESEILASIVSVMVITRSYL